MSFSRAKPTGWVSKEVITPTQINQIDLNQSRAVDGNAGGDYSPSTPIVLKTGATRMEVEEDALKYQDDAFPLLTNRTVYGNTVVSPHSFDSDAGLISTYDTTIDFKFTSLILTQNYANATNTPYFYMFFNPAIRYGTLYTLILTIEGVAGHSALPGTMPQWILYKNANTTAYTSIASATDSSATVGAYEAKHEISNSSFTETIDDSNFATYLIKISGEGGTNAATGTVFYNLTAYYHVTEIRP